MEQRLKERMVGAAVLVGLGVLLIPALLDGPDDPVRTMDIPLPAGTGDTEKAAGTRTRVFRLNEDSEEKSAPSGAATKARVEQSSGAADQGRSIVSAAEKPAPVVTTSKKSDTAATGATGQSKSGWAAQAGSFGKKANAEKLAGTLEAKGFEAFVTAHRASGKTYYRVRVGPYPDRAGAESMVSRLAAEGQKATVVPHP